MKRLFTVAVLLMAASIFCQASLDKTYPNVTPNLEFNIAVGDHTNKTGYWATGYNATVEDGWEDVWTLGATEPTILATAEVLDIVSTDADDANGDTGATTIYIQGLDANYDIQSEYVVMNGTTDVETTGSYLMVYRMVVFYAGTTGSNEGVITAEDDSDNVLCQIAVGDNQSQLAFLMVPDDYKAVLYSLYVCAAYSSGDETRFRLLTCTTSAAGVQYPCRTAAVILSTGGCHNYDIPVPAVATERTVIKVQAYHDHASNTIWASAAVGLVMISDWTQ